MALGLALLVTTGAEASQKKHKPKTMVKKSKPWTGAESALVGIKLYDPSLKVIETYGTPDEIQGLNIGTSAVNGNSPGAGAGMGPGGPGMGNAAGGRGGGKRGGGGGGSAASAAADIGDPFQFGDTVLMQGKLGGMDGGDAPGPGMGAPGGMGPGRGGPGGPPAGIPGAPGGKGGGAGVPGAGGGAQDRVTFTRWVYNKEGSKYAFIVDKQGRVVQIEAIGIDNAKVRTRRGVGFGSTFAEVVKSYQQPDGYEIGGDNLMVKYLVHDNVAFRLSRIASKKPQVVTGIVVAAGKS